MFSSREGENYADPDSLLVLMDTVCPPCDTGETVLVGMEEYQETVFVSKSPSGGQ